MDVNRVNDSVPADLDKTRNISLLMNLPLELQEQIYSYFTPQDVESLSCTFTIFQDKTLYTSIVCVLARQGYVYDVIQQYLLGKVDSRVLGVFLEVLLTISGDEYERLLECFVIHLKSICTKIESEKDWDACLPFVQLNFLSYFQKTRGSKSLPYNDLAKFIFNWIKNVPDDFPLFIVQLHTLWKSCEDRSTRRSEFGEVLSGTMIKLYKYGAHEKLPFSKDLNEMIYAIADSKAALIKFYHAYYMTDDYLTEFRNLDNFNQLVVSENVIITDALKCDALADLSSKIGFENISGNYTIERLLAFTFSRGYPNSFQFLVRKLPEDEQQLVEFLVDDDVSQIPDDIVSDCREESIKENKPLKYAILLRQWDKAVAVLKCIDNTHSASDGACKIVDEFLKAHRGKMKTDELKKLINSLLELSGATDSGLKNLLKYCFYYRKKVSRFILERAQAPVECCFDSWLYCGEENMKFFQSFIFKKLSSLESQKEKDDLIFSFLLTLGLDSRRVHNSSDDGYISKISEKYRSKLFRKLVPMLSEQKRFNVMTIKFAYKHLPPEAFLFPTLKLT